MRFPYGIADFHKLITEGYFYVDRTAHLAHIEDDTAQLLFLRPRRFGKSLWLSTLENYYDLAKADDFERLFGHLAVGRNPTPKRNQYFVLKWDFSTISAHGTAEDIVQAMHNHINAQIERFALRYQARLSHEIKIDPKDAIYSFQSLLNAVSLTPHRLYLLIDEYDNFANELLMSGQPASRERYEALLRGEGALKTVFKTVKAGATGMGVDRVFITGVAPVVLSDLSSGYNVAENISLRRPFQSLCGFTEAEIAEAVGQVVADCGLDAPAAEQALSQMRLYYNGYRFSDAPGEAIYNPTLALYFLKHFQENCRPPENLLDSNLAMDRGKLRYIASLPGGAQLLTEALNDDASVNVPVLSDRFGVEDVLTVNKDAGFMASLLYYFGALTLAGRDSFGNLQLRIPNLVIRKLYVERIQTLLLPDTDVQAESQFGVQAFQRTGNLQPICDFIEQRYFRVFSNRDYLQANELTIKTAFLTLLFNDLLYILDSETTAGRRYADLTMIVRPDARQYQILDLLVEFKYVKLGEAGLSGNEVRQMSEEELRALPAVQQKLVEARAQAPEYVRELTARYAQGLRMELRLRAFAVVALGFERLVWEEIEQTS